jgi:hypothetical protein
MHGVVWLIFVCVSSVGHAQTPHCEKLAGDDAIRAAELLAALHPYDCCMDTIATCLTQEPQCTLAVRLADNICARVALGQDNERIVWAFAGRALSMVSTRRSIDLHGMPEAGNADSPVVVVEFACGRYPYCATITPLLHDSVVNGRLKDKAALHFTVFPLRGHPGSKEAGMAFLAATALGHFWPYALHHYDHYQQFTPELRAHWVEEIGFDRTRFVELLDDSGLLHRLIETKKRGILLNVDASPTFFINGRKFVGELSLDELVDAIEEEADRILDRRYQTVKPEGERDG